MFKNERNRYTEALFWTWDKIFAAAFKLFDFSVAFSEPNFSPIKIANSLVKTCSYKKFKMATSLLNPASILFLSLNPLPIHLLQRMLFDCSELLLLAQRCTCPPFTQRCSALLNDYSALLRATLELLSVVLMCMLFTQCCSELLIIVI